MGAAGSSCCSGSPSSPRSGPSSATPFQGSPRHRWRAAADQGAGRPVPACAQRPGRPRRAQHQLQHRHGPAPAERAAAGGADLAGRDVATARVGGAGRRYRDRGGAADQRLASLDTPEEDAAAILDPTDPAAAIALPYPRSKPVPPEPVVDAEPIETTISALPQVEPAAPPESRRRSPPQPPAPRRHRNRNSPSPSRSAPSWRPSPSRGGAARVAAAPAPGPQRLVRADPAAEAAAGAAAAGERRGHLPSAARGGPLGRG